MEADKIKQDKIYELIKQENPGVLNHIVKTTRLVQVQENDPETANVIKDILQNKATINKADATKIINIIEKMEKYGIAPTSRVGSEQVSKTYAFSKLNNLGNELKKELEKGNKNRNKIIELTEKYNDLEQKYDELLKDISKLGSPYEFTGNVSSSREKEISEKYRNNIVNVSKLNALYISLGYFKGINKDPKEFFENPFQQQIENNKRLLSKDTLMSNIFERNKNNRIEFLKVCIDPINNDTNDKELFNSLNKVYAETQGIDRATSGIISLINDEKNRRELEKQFMFYSGTITAKIGNIISGMIAGGFDTTKAVANYLIAPDEDFNVFSFSNDRTSLIDPETLEAYEPYDTKTALEKGGAKKPIDRIIQLNDTDIYAINKLHEITTTVINDIEKSKVELSSNDKHILKFLKKDKKVPYNLVTNLKAEISLEEVNKRGLNKDNVLDLLKDYAKAKQEYSGRSFIAKWFFKGVKNQSKIIESMETKMKALCELAN